MRAGLLSQPEVIQRINQQFVSTTLSYPVLKKYADSGHAIAREVLLHWNIPLVLVFLTPEGQFITKLSSLAELTEVHPDTTKRTEATQYHNPESEVNNTRVFLKHLDKCFQSKMNP